VLAALQALQGSPEADRAVIRLLNSLHNDHRMAKSIEDSIDFAAKQ
jgi:hypothetical protein